MEDGPQQSVGYPTKSYGSIDEASSIERNQLKKTESPLETVKNRLGYDIEQLSAVIGHLNSKLSPILSPEPTSDKTVGSDHPGTSDLISQLNQYADMIEMCTDAVRSLSRRSEV